MAAATRSGRILCGSMGKSIYRSQLHGNVHSKVTGKEISRTISTSFVQGYMGDQTESTMKSIQKEIVEALCLGKRDRATNMLSNLFQENYSLGPHDLVDVLRHCARSPDPLFALETWRMMKEKDTSLNYLCCMLITQALCKGGYLEEAFNFINFIEEKDDVHPGLPIYNLFLGFCRKMQNMVHVNQCLDLMEQKMVGKNEITYVALLNIAVWQKSLSAAHSIMHDYIKGYNLNIFSLRKFIWSFARLGDLKCAFGLLQHMVALAIQGDSFIAMNTRRRFLHSSRLDIPILVNSESSTLNLCLKEENEQAGHLQTDACTRNIRHITFHDIRNVEVKAAGWMRWAKYRSNFAVKVLRCSFTDVIEACARTQNCNLAEQLVLQMQKIGVHPSRETFDGLVSVVARKRGFQEGMEMFKIMQRRNIMPCDSTLATLSMCCSKALELDLAEALLEQICNYRHIGPFNLFLAACDVMDQPERAVKMLAKMKTLKLKMNIKTYELLFSLFGTVNAPYENGNILSHVDCARRINAIEMDMEKNNVQHSYISMNNLLNALGQEGMIKELIKYLNMAKVLFGRSKTHMGIDIYNTVLHYLVKAKENNLVVEVFKNLKSGGMPADATTYDIMIDHCSNKRCYKSASAFVSMMLRDGFYPKLRTYTALIKVLLTKYNFDEALNLLDKGRSEGIRPCLLLYNTILVWASRKGRIDVIELIVEQMHREKVKPDASTCRYVFSAYLRRRFRRRAMEALQVLSMRMISEKESTLLKKRSEFEDDFILSEDPKAESLIVQLFEDSRERIACAILNLRWIAIVEHPICWSPNKTRWARRLSAKYDARKGWSPNKTR